MVSSLAQTPEPRERIDYESEMVGSLKETMFSMHNKANKCTRELTETRTICTGPEQVQARWNLHMKKGKRAQSPTPSQMTATGRERIRSLQWSGIGCIRHTPGQVPCSVVGQHKLISMTFSGSCLAVVMVMVVFIERNIARSSGRGEDLGGVREQERT